MCLKEYNIKPNKVSGIYVIKNLINSKIYIGSSNNVYIRLLGHRSSLCKGNHKNEHLQNAWNKYGEKMFTFDLLEEHDEKYLTSMEQWWINMTNAANREYGYNILSIAGNNIGIGAKKVYQFDLNGKFLNKYSSVIAASKALKISTPSNISKAALGKLNTAAGFLWSYTKEVKVPNFDLPRHNSKSVTCFDMNGKFIKKYKSICDAEKETGATNGAINNVCVGKALHSKGYLWSYTEIPIEYKPLGHFIRPVICLDTNGTFINKYDSIKEASEKTGTNKTSIQKLCSGQGRLKTAGGYIWKYES